MPRFLILSLVLGVGIGVFDGVPSTAEAGRGQGVVECATINGDVNADDTLNISDARRNPDLQRFGRGRRGRAPFRIQAIPERHGIMKYSRVFWLLAFAPIGFLVAPSPVWAEEELDSKVPDLSATGKLGSNPRGKKEYFEFSYSEIGEKGKPVKKKIWLKVESGTHLYRDVRATLANFKEGEELRIFGKPVERRGYGKRLRLIQATRIIIGGEEVEVNESFADPKDKDFKWVTGTVAQTGKALKVNYSGGEYKVTLERRAAIIKRLPGEQKRDVKKNAMVIITANETEEASPDEKKDYPVYKAETLIVMEKRFLGSYSALGNGRPVVVRRLRTPRTPRGRGPCGGP